MVKKMNDIVNTLAIRFGGTIAKQDECKIYLTEQQRFLFGLNFNDPKANYLLLTENDLQKMSHAMRAVSTKERCSPFSNLKLIVYTDDSGEINFKLLHGMAGRLVIEMVALCEQPELFVGIDSQ